MRSFVDDLYLHSMLRCAREESTRVIGATNKNIVLRHSWALPNNSKHNGANFQQFQQLTIRVAQIPRYQDLVIFVLTDRQTDRTNYACARGNEGLEITYTPDIVSLDKTGRASASGCISPTITVFFLSSAAFAASLAFRQTSISIYTHKKKNFYAKACR